jgi:DNA-binding NarL/FixJ family response regulator
VRPEQESAAIQLGADGFLLKQLTPDQFMIALISAVNQHEIQK